MGVSFSNREKQTTLSVDSRGEHHVLCHRDVLELVFVEGRFMGEWIHTKTENIERASAGIVTPPAPRIEHSKLANFLESKALEEELASIDGSDIQRVINELLKRGGADTVLGRFLSHSLDSHFSSVDPETTDV